MNGLAFYFGSVAIGLTPSNACLQCDTSGQGTQLQSFLISETLRATSSIGIVPAVSTICEFRKRHKWFGSGHLQQSAAPGRLVPGSPAPGGMD
jgi:hypothetical protein